jgi:hypothetical protein
MSPIMTDGACCSGEPQKTAGIDLAKIRDKNPALAIVDASGERLAVGAFLHVGGIRALEPGL